MLPAAPRARSAASVTASLLPPRHCLRPIPELRKSYEAVDQASLSCGFTLVSTVDVSSLDDTSTNPWNVCEQRLARSPAKIYDSATCRL